MVALDAVVFCSDGVADGILDVEKKWSAYSVGFADTDELALELDCFEEVEGWFCGEFFYEVDDPGFFNWCRSGYHTAGVNNHPQDNSGVGVREIEFVLGDGVGVLW